MRIRPGRAGRIEQEQDLHVLAQALLDERAKVAALLADPRRRLVSLTVNGRRIDTGGPVIISVQ